MSTPSRPAPRALATARPTSGKPSTSGPSADGPRAAAGEEGTGGWRRWLGPAIGVLLLLVALVVLRHELRAHSYHEIAAAVRAIPAAQLRAALLWTVVAYTVLPGYDALALTYIGRLRGSRSTAAEGEAAGGPRAVGLRRTGLAGFIAYAMSQTLGFAAVTGSAVRYRFWTAWGLSTIEIGRAVTFAGATFFLGVVLVAGLSLLLEPATELAALHVPAALGRAAGAALALAVALYVVWTARADGRTWRLPVHRLPLALARRLPPEAARWTLTVPRPRLAAAQLAVGLADWCAAAAVLWVLLPTDARPSFPTFAGVFVVAQFAGLVSHVPGGLGVFETLMVLALRSYLPAGQTLAALVAYRAVYYLLPFAGALVLLLAYQLRCRRTRLGAAARRTGRLAAALGPSLVPNALAAAVFAAGTVLLLSGATPSVRPRVSALLAVVPLGIVEASHLLGSVVGALLLVLAWALRHRLGAAWGLAVGLLAAGVLTSLLKGLDWEEALVQAVVLGAVLPFRRAFYRRAALTAEPFEPGWVLAIAAVLGVTAWVGLFAYQHVEYANDLWWRVRPHADAPRFLRATLASAGVLAVLGARRLLRPARPAAPAPDAAALAHAADVAARCTDTASWLALLGDKTLLFRAAGEPGPDGFVQYAVSGRSWVALGDPVVADVGGPTHATAGDPLAVARARSALAWRFKGEADAHGGWPVFYEVPADSLPIYIDLGLTFLKLGEEARVDLASFSLDGGARKGLRRAVRDVEQEGARFEVLPPERVSEMLPVLRAVSDAWLAHKRVREKGFSLGFFDDAYVHRFPVAVVHGPAGDVVAFANLWPGGGRVELSLDLMRFSEHAPKGVMDYLFVRLMLWGQGEGFRWFNLGMAPLAGLEGRQLAPLWARAGAWLYRHGEHFYNYQGLRQYKAKFDPVWKPRYLASPGGLALPRILANVAALISGGLAGAVRR